MGRLFYKKTCTKEKNTALMFFMENISGFILLDKPAGITSRAAGNRVRRLFGAKTFGHIGTLDPMASGLLIVALGNATKMIPFMDQNHPKEYEFALRFGFETDTLDITGHVTQQTDKIPQESAVLDACRALTGRVMQTPPVFSAVHVGGVRAYDLARRGVMMDLPPRPVHIAALSLDKIVDNQWFFHVKCSAGTYVRSIGRDLGRAVGSMATVTMIRRTATNGVGIKDAVSLDFLENLVNNGGNACDYLHAPDFGLGDIPVINLGDNDADLYTHGGFVTVDATDGMARVYCGNRFIGMGTVSSNLLRPKRII